MTVKVVRSTADKVLFINDSVLSTCVFEIARFVDAAVNDRHSDTGAIQAINIPSSWRSHGRGYIVKGSAHVAVGRDVRHVGIVSQGIQRLSRNGIVGGLDEVQVRLQNPALALHLLVVGIRRRLVELDNDVYR